MVKFSKSCQFLDKFSKSCENSESVLSEIRLKLLKLLLKLRGRLFFPSYFDQQEGVLQLKTVFFSKNTEKDLEGLVTRLLLAKS